MKGHAYIDYELDGKRYRWAGALDFYKGIPSLEAAVDSLIDEGCQGKNPNFKLPEDAILRAGGRILEIHSIRPDGSIEAEDLPDLYIP